MYLVNEFKFHLTKVKNVIMRLRSEFELVELLENYKQDRDLVKIEELMKEADYQIAGKNNYQGQILFILIFKFCFHFKLNK